jgi:hypothetical protein
MAAMLALTLSAAGAVTAGAEDFTFTQIGGFNSTTSSSNTGGPNTGIEFFFNVGTPPNTYAIIGWGDGSTFTKTPAANPYTNGDRSALAIETNGTPQGGLPVPFTDAMATTISDNGVPVVISRLYHNNNAITNPTLTAVRIDTQLTIFNDVAQKVIDSPGKVSIGFLETTNLANCIQTSNPLGSHCDDRFTFTTSDFATINFSSEGLDYQLIFGLSVPSGFTNCNPIQVSGEDSCVDLANGVAFTREDNENRLDVTMRLVQVGTPTQHTTEVPLPGTLLLLGAGLIGGAAARTSRKRQVAA